MMKAIVEYPYMRIEILDSLRQLSDATYQKRTWLDPDGAVARGEYFDFDQVFHTIFDDCPSLAEDPHGTIGEYLTSAAEADAMVPLVHSLDFLLKRYGPLISPQQALSDPEWSNVLSFAKQALIVFDSIT